mmetsp:Transcript_23612/g.54959  ORF Transcript_23612/g.54959 Transcript_23612/m.54959 type:complete len:394 (-) Transcript_23612:207-1388(-)
MLFFKSRICVLRNCLVATLFCLLSTFTRAWGIQVRGLDISQINTRLATDSSTATTGKHLEEMLETITFPTSSINPSIEIIFSEERNTPGSDTDFTNTDEEMVQNGSEENEIAAATQPIRFSLNTYADGRNLKKVHLLGKYEFSKKLEKGVFSMNLCKKLAEDAFRIANADSNVRARGSTTCLCVVLRDKYQYAKKFVFHNGKNKMLKNMEKKATELCYAIKTSYQSHAEVALLQFLIQRSQLSPNRYTHLLGMGCSRKHCKECDCLLRLYLGANYHLCTAAMQEETSSSQEKVVPIITTAKKGGLRMEIPTKVTIFDAVHKQEAVGDKIYPKYYLPHFMKEDIKEKSGLLHLDFSNKRFCIKDETKVIAKRQKKRKASELSMSKKSAKKAQPS